MVISCSSHGNRIKISLKSHQNLMEFSLKSHGNIMLISSHHVLAQAVSSLYGVHCLFFLSSCPLYVSLLGGATSCWTLETPDDGCLKGFEWTRSYEDFKTICKLTGITAVCKLRGAKAAAEMLVIVCSHPLHRCS